MHFGRYTEAIARNAEKPPEDGTGASRTNGKAAGRSSPWTMVFSRLRASAGEGWICVLEDGTDGALHRDGVIVSEARPCRILRSVIS